MPTAHHVFALVQEVKDLLGRVEAYHVFITGDEGTALSDQCLSQAHRSNGFPNFWILIQGVRQEFFLFQYCLLDFFKIAQFRPKKIHGIKSLDANSGLPAKSQVFFLT